MKIIKRVRLWWFMLGQKRHAAKQDHNVCCCGDDMDRHADPMSCGHSPVSEVDYSLYCAEKWKRSELGL